MPELPQLSSERGLSSVPGEVAQEDIFFFDVGAGKVKVPVLLVVCEASLFLFMYVFIDAALRAKGPRVMVKPPELLRALEGILNLWKCADHQLKRIRFVR
jgi:hypothetical protein